MKNLTFISLLLSFFLWNCKLEPIRPVEFDIHSNEDSVAVQAILDANDLEWDSDYIKWNDEGRIEVLDLSNLGITQIPENIETLTELKELNLQNNKIRHLPSELENLSQLEVLELAENLFTEIPPEILALENIKDINIENNPIQKLPSDVTNLASQLPLLEGLEIDNYQWCQLPQHIRYQSEVWEWAMTQTFILSDPHCFYGHTPTKPTPPESTFVPLPDDTATSLRSRDDSIAVQAILDANNLDWKDIYVRWFEEDGRVHELQFKNIALKELPVDFLLLEELDKVSFINTELKHFPQVLSYHQNVHSVIIQNNFIKFISKDIMQMHQLLHLDIRGNPLECPLPNYLDSNVVTQWAPNIQNYYTDSCVNTLPPHNSDDSIIVQRILNHNKLGWENVNIKWSKENGRINELKFQDVDFYYLSPDIMKLDELSTISFINNRLTNFPKTLMQHKNITNVIIQKNNIQQISTSITQMNQLELLDLRGNPINCPLADHLDSNAVTQWAPNIQNYYINPCT